MTGFVSTATIGGNSAVDLTASSKDFGELTEVVHRGKFEGCLKRIKPTILATARREFYRIVVKGKNSCDACSLDA